MTTIEIFAQTVGIAAMLFNIFSFQGKSQRNVIALQLLGSTLFSVNYFLLGATVGGILNILSIIRAIIFIFKDKFKADSIYWFIFFVSSYVSIYILNFTVFNKEATVFNIITEILPIISMIMLTIGYRLKNSANIRKYGLVSSPAWLIYNIIVGSWGGIICELFTMISIFIGILRHDKKH